MLSCEHNKGVACGPCCVKWFQENRTFLVQIQTLVDYYESQKQTEQDDNKSE